MIHRAQSSATPSRRSNASAGSSVTVGKEPMGPGSLLRPSPPDLIGCRRTLGPDFLDTATYVFLQGEQCDDASLRAACQLPWLEELNIVNTGVTDAAAEEDYLLVPRLHPGRRFSPSCTSHLAQIERSRYEENEYH